MLLRASGELEGQRFDLRGVTEGEAAASGVLGGDALLAFCDAAHAGDEVACAAARARVQERLGAAAVVDAAAVIGNFERMVRIADGTGIPLDEPLAFVTSGLRADLGIDRYASAAHTRRSGVLRRMLGRALAPFASRMMARYRTPE
jgi:hypothetical protein